MHVETGHRRVEDPKGWAWVEKVMRAQLTKLRRSLVGVTSLVIRAHQLLARLGLEAGGMIHAVVSFADIDRSFSPKDLPAFS